MSFLLFFAKRHNFISKLFKFGLLVLAIILQELILLLTQHKLHQNRITGELFSEILALQKL